MVTPITTSYNTSAKESDAKTRTANTKSFDSKVSSIAASQIQSAASVAQKPLNQQIDQKMRASINQVPDNSLPTENIDSLFTPDVINLVNVICRAIPQPTPDNFDNADRSSREVFPLGDFFPTWLSWGYSIYFLLQKYLPSDAEKWLRILSQLKCCDQLKAFTTHVPAAVIEEAHTPMILRSVQELVELYQNCSKKLAKQPKIQDLLDHLAIWQDVLPSNGQFKSTPIELNTQDSYLQLLEFMVFIDKLTRLSPGNHSHIIPGNHAILPQFKWKEFFPSKLTDLNEKRIICIREMFKSYSKIKMIAYNCRGKVWYTSANQPFIVVDTLNKPIPSYKATLRKSDDLFYASTHTVAESVYHSIYTSIMPIIADKTIFDPSAIDGLSQQITKVGVNTFPDKSVAVGNSVLKMGSELIKKSAIENKWSLSLQALLTGLFIAMEKNLKTKPFALIHFPNSIPLGYAFKTGCPFIMFQCLQIELTNLSNTVKKLNGFQQEILTFIKEKLKSFPKAEFLLQSSKIEECIRELNIIASKPLVDMLEMFFGLARLIDEEQFVFTVNADEPSSGIEQDVVNFLSMSGLKKVFKQARKEADHKNQESGQIATSQLDLKDEPKFSSLSVLPPSGQSFNDANSVPVQAKPRSKKAKSKKTAQAVSQTAATKNPPPLTAAGPALATTAEENDKEDVYETIPTTIPDLIKLLERYNYALLREGHRHSIYKAEGKESISVPRHKDGAKGTIAKIRNQVVKK